MNFRSLFGLFFILLGSMCTAKAQSESEEKPTPLKIKKKRFQAGLYVGAYMANDYTASAYDGFGLNSEGKKNDFYNSLMYRRIVVDYGGAYGQRDQIAEALNVPAGEWTFDRSDMPVNLAYIPAFMVGFNGRFNWSKKDHILVNVNASKLKLHGDFTITLTNPPIGVTASEYEKYKTFSIEGGEQRLQIEIGYQRIFDAESNFNFFLEGGIMMTIVRFDKEELYINDLTIPLTGYYYAPGFESYTVGAKSEIGIGAFGGIGLNMSFNEKWTAQLLYNPTYETIKIVENSIPALQHSLGMRFYYNF